MLVCRIHVFLKRPPRGPQDGSRRFQAAQYSSKTAQDSSQGTPKRATGVSLDGLRGPEEGPKTASAAQNGPRGHWDGPISPHTSQKKSKTTPKMLFQKASERLPVGPHQGMGGLASTSCARISETLTEASDSRSMSGLSEAPQKHAGGVDKQPRRPEFTVQVRGVPPWAGGRGANVGSWTFGGVPNGTRAA